MGVRVPEADWEFTEQDSEANGCADRLGESGFGSPTRRSPAIRAGGA